MQYRNLLTRPAYLSPAGGGLGLSAIECSSFAERDLATAPNGAVLALSCDIGARGISVSIAMQRGGLRYSIAVFGRENGPKSTKTSSNGTRVGALLSYYDRKKS